MQKVRHRFEVLLPTSGTQETVLLLLPCLADVDDAEQALIVGSKNISLESMLYGGHSASWKTIYFYFVDSTQKYYNAKNKVVKTKKKKTI